MKSRTSIGAALLSLLLLSACGGGGDDPDDTTAAGTPAAPNAPVENPASLVLTSGEFTTTFSPGVAVVQMMAGEDGATELEVVLKGPYDEAVYGRVSDAHGRMIGMFEATATDAGRYRARINITPDLAEGQYTGELNLRLCRDWECKTLYPGSPWALPYKIKVATAVWRLPTLSAKPGVGNWTTYRGNARHTGYVPMSLTGTGFSTRWIWRASYQAPGSPIRSFGINPIAIADGVVYVSTPNSGHDDDAQNLVFALRESDGNEIWHKDLGPLYDTSAPGLSDTHVFIASSGHEDTFMWALDKATGAITQRAPFSSQWSHYYAPTVVDGRAYSNGGGHGGMLRADGQSANIDWFTELSQFDQWTPAVDGGYAYAYLNATCCRFAPGLFILNAETGAIERIIEDQDSLDGFSGYSMYSAPVMSASNRLMAVNGIPFNGQNRLTMFDLATGTVAWKIRGHFPSSPAYAKGVVYIAQSSPFRVEVRNESNGALLWTWTEPGGAEAATPMVDPRPAGAMVLTDTHLFVSSRHAVHAIDLRTRQSIWSYPRAGELALSANGVLYIAPSWLNYTGTAGEGRLVAINLK